MDRRSFLSISGLSFCGMVLPSVGSARPNAAKRVVSIDTYRLSQDSDPNRLRRHLLDPVETAARGAHAGRRLHFEAVLAPHLPQIVTIAEYTNFEEMTRVRQALAENSRVQRSFQALAGGSNPQIEQVDSQILVSLDEISALSHAQSKGVDQIVEFRTYHSPVPANVAGLHDVLAEPVTGGFAAAGVAPILAGATMHGRQLPNVLYVVPFESVGAREQAWSRVEAHSAVAAALTSGTRVVEVALYGSISMAAG